MVTTGRNGNDDAFLPEEAWAARETPADKPRNLEHDPTRIVGHIPGQRAAGTDLRTIETDANLRAKCHLIAEGVLHRHQAKRKESLAIDADALIDEIKAGDWAVSMECLFDSFDDMVGDKIIARQESTAFLTKRLRALNGSGSFRGEAVDRVSWNVQFSALGIVKSPANPHSRFL